MYAEELAGHLRRECPQCEAAISAPEPSGFGPAELMVFTVEFILGFGGLTAAVDWMRNRRRCLLIVDARHEDVVVRERCDLDSQSGRVIVIANESTQVSIQTPHGLLNLDALTQAAVRGALDEMTELAERAGCTAEVRPLLDDGEAADS